MCVRVYSEEYDSTGGQEQITCLRAQTHIQKGVKEEERRRQHGYAVSHTDTHIHTAPHLSPNTLSTRPTVGQYLLSFSLAGGAHAHTQR